MNWEVSHISANLWVSEPYIICICTPNKNPRKEYFSLCVHAELRITELSSLHWERSVEASAAEHAAVWRLSNLCFWNSDLQRSTESPFGALRKLHGAFNLTRAVQVAFWCSAWWPKKQSHCFCKPFPVGAPGGVSGGEPVGGQRWAWCGAGRGWMGGQWSGICSCSGSMPCLGAPVHGARQQSSLLQCKGAEQPRQGVLERVAMEECCETPNN